MSWPSAAVAQTAAAPRIDFVYFGSPDCPYCRAWEVPDLPRLRMSKLFDQVRFSKIEKAIRSAVPAALAFPDEIKYLRRPIAEQIQGAGSPMFAILADGKVVESWRGAKKYSPDQILDIIKRQQTQMSDSATRQPVVNPDVAQTERTAPIALSAATATH